MSEGVRERRLPVPDALGERDAGIEASIRKKFANKEPLTPEEQFFFARMPATRELSPGTVSEAAKKGGGVQPQRAIDEADRRDEAR